MRMSFALLAAVVTMPPAATAQDAPYYGPMKPWRGIGYKFGYEDRIEADGTWRVTAATRRGESIDMAMYRAAERARDEGYAFVELLGGSASRSPGYASATVYARPSRSPAAPTACRSKRRGSCYTADVGEVLRRLGGPGGQQPGVPVTDHLDEYGRAVSYSGFGIGAARVDAPQPRYLPMPVVRPVPTPVPAVRAAQYRAVPGAADRFEQALKDAQPVRGRSKDGRWTISD